MQAPGDQYPVYRAPSTERFRPSISIHDTTDFRSPPFSGTLADYVAKTRKYLAHSTDVAEIAESEFTTQAGAVGYRLTYTQSHTVGLLQAFAYFFDGPGGRKTALYCLCLAQSRAAHESIFDSVLQSLKFES